MRVSLELYRNIKAVMLAPNFKLVFSARSKPVWGRGYLGPARFTCELKLPTVNSLHSVAQRRERARKVSKRLLANGRELPSLPTTCPISPNKGCIVS